MRKFLIPLFAIFFTSCGLDICDCTTTKNMSNTTYPNAQFNMVGLKIKDGFYCLTDSQIQNLLSLLTNEQSYRDGECGTYFKEGVFLFGLKKEGKCEIVSEVQFGCNQSQLRFSPNESKFKYGLLTLEASEKFSSLISEIIN